MKRLDFKLKPIPKYIVKRIQKSDKERCPEQKGPIRFYSYLSKIKGELVKVTVATITRYKRWCCKQVAVHGVKSDKCFVRDMEYTPLGGYRIGFYAEGMVKHKPWYEDGFWYDADFKYYNPFSTTVNVEYVGRFSQYKFSAYQHLTGDCTIKYLRIYLKYPQTEYLLKLGLSKLHDKLTILKLIAKDKKFCKWLIAHGNEIATSYCYAGVLIKAYRTSRPITQTQKIEEFKKRLRNDTSLQVIKKMFGDKLEQFFAYITNQNTDPNSYLDYLNACNYLKLDMSLPKNYFPHDFKRWHDIRIDQYHTAKAKADEKERKKLYKQFATVAKKYLSLQNCKKGAYAVFIARSPFELTCEGEQLKHCVGRMNYDQKMVREETLIFFVRSIDKPYVPFVTVEYSLKTKRVLQCYGYDSQKPDDNVLDFVNKTWLSYANRTIKKLKTLTA